MRLFQFTWCIGLLALASCSKDVDVFTPNDLTQVQRSKDSLVLHQFESFARPIAPTWRWDAAEEHTIELPNAVQLYFPPNAFAGTAQSLIDGEVEVRVTPMLTVGEMARSGISCLTDGALLEMGGVVDIQVNQGAQRLELAADKSITVTLPAYQSLNQLEVYIAEANNWIKAIEQYADFDFEVREDEVFNSTQDQWIAVYQFSTPTIGRLAIGQLAEATQGKSDICFDLPSPLEYPIAKVFAVSNTLNSVVQLDWREVQYCTADLLAGTTFEFVFIGVFEEQYYYDRISMDLLNTSQTAFFNPSIYAAEDIVLLLNSF